MSLTPRIRYTKTSDGVSIAFWTLGEGPALFVSSPFVFCHAGLEGRIPLLEALYRRFAANRMVIRWDVRNYGKSQRGVEDLSPEAWASDVLAVADELDLAAFDFVGNNHHPTVAALAPDRVRRVALVAPSPPRLGDLLDDPNQAAVRSLAASNWDVFTETHATFLQGWKPDPETDLARFIRESVSQSDYLRIMDAWRSWDVTPHLAHIQCPTLILTTAGVPSSHAMARGWLTYASEIDGATLVECEGRHPLQSEAGWEALDRFLDLLPPVHGTAHSNDEVRPESIGNSDGHLRAVLFTDIVDHTAMMIRLGDTAGHAVIREHDRVMRESLRLHGGTEVKTLGDGFFASFDSVSQAVRCAAALQQKFADDASTADEPIQIRIGLNVGEPVQEDGDLFGATVIIAARVAAIAGPGQVLVPAAVRHLLAGKGFVFVERGEYTLKGFDAPVHLCEVDWQTPRRTSRG